MRSKIRLTSNPFREANLANTTPLYSRPLATTRGSTMSGTKGSVKDQKLFADFQQPSARFTKRTSRFLAQGFVYH